MDPDRLVALTLASVVLIAVPGPSVLFVVGRSLAHGRRIALLSVAGNSLGALTAAAVVAVGLGPALERSEQLLLAVKLAGAAYLVWLGVSAVRSRAVGHVPPAPHGPSSAGRAVRQGVLVGLLNPKIVLFFTAFLPQFVVPDGPPVPVQLLLLALVPVTVGLVLDTAWGLAAGAARGWVATDPRRLLWTTRGGGALMIGLGGGLLVETARRP